MTGGKPITMASLDSYLTLVSCSISLVFLLLFPWRSHQLRKQTIKVKPGSWRGVSKLVSATSLALVQLITAFILAPDSHHGQHQYPYILLFGIPPVTASFALIFLSSLEHRRSIRPSSLILVYLLSSLICDIVQLTAPSLRYTRQNGQHLYPMPELFAKALVLATELLLDKQPDLLEPWRTLPPEEKSSIFGRSLMWWMNTILARGYRNTLINEELPQIDHALSSRVLREKILEVWSSDAASGSSPWLLSVAVKCFLRPGLLLVIWRVSLIVFRYSQPILITYSIAFLNSPSSSRDEGFFIVLAAIFVHAGYAFSVRAYLLGLNRLEVMLRGSLIGLIHQSSLVASPHESQQDTDKGNNNSTPVALVTTDVTTLEDAVETFYVTWACTIEVIIGTIMLARQVGWVWPLPHLITIFCSRISAYVARNLKKRQGEWNAATRKRIAVTSSVLSSAKTVKMLGLQDAVERQILELRKEETDKAARVRWIRVVYNASANALGMFAPVITIVVFAIIASFKGEALNPETAFPTIAILALVTHSANMVMTTIPKAVAAYPSFERIQSFLQPTDLRTNISLHTISRDTPEQAIRAILIKNLNITWNNGQEALSDINISIPKGTIAACCGPVGSGKTTLTRAILGEIRAPKGVVETSTGKIAYCAQTAWLPNRTVKEVIYGPAKTHNLGVDDSEEDTAWYETVLRACCLDEDFATTLPDGDATVVGNGGTNLSGGQRQRVALARAVFQRCEIAVLDDVFSALDGRTEERVAENLFGTADTGGLFRKLGTTVFWITSSTQHFHMTDYVVVLEAGGRIQEQGRWSDLKASEQQQISKLIHSHGGDENKESADETKSQKQQQLTSKPKPTDELSPGDGDTSLYGYYFTAAGLHSIMLLFSCTASTAFFMTAPSYWMKFWTEDSLSPQQHRSATFYATIYSLLSLSAWISTNGIMSSQLLLVAPRASLTLHARLLHTILSAPLSYFSSTQTGTIINHFTQDISLVDKTIAPSFSSFSAQIFKLLFQFLVLFAVQPLIILTVPICFTVIYLVQRVYLRTSRQIRIIELESRSSVFSSLLETSTGVETIRAFKWTPCITEENITALDLSQRPFYLLVCLQRWLGIVLNLLGGGIAVMVITLGVLFKGTTTGAQIGVALNVLLVTKDTLLKLVDFWTGLEIALGAVARLRGVEEGTPKEELEEVEMGDGGDGDDGSLWPTEGKLELRGVSASYSDDSTALRDINLEVSPGETVAVCGRTGSGKSSLLLTLLRLLRLKSGSILVDGIDITHIPLSKVRQRCFVTIAQDPYFLHEASLRFNLDPSGSLSTSELVRILDRVGLWSHLLATCRSDPGSKPSLSSASSIRVLSADDTSLSKRSDDDNNQDSEVGSGCSSIKAPTANGTGDGNDGGHPGERTPLLSAYDDINYTPDISKADAILKTPISQIPPLSGGQAQLLALARGIAQSQSQSFQYPTTSPSPDTNPKWKPIILLDEITSSLDAHAEQTVCEIVEQEFIAKGHTVIMVTHRIGPFLDARRRMARLTSNSNKDKGLTVVWMKGGRVDKVERSVN